MNPPGAAWRDRPAIDQGDDRFLAILAAALPGACRGEDRPDGEAHPWSGEPADRTGVGYQLIMRGGVLRGEATSPHPGGARTTVLAWNRLPWRADRPLAGTALAMTIRKMTRPFGCPVDRTRLNA